MEFFNNNKPIPESPHPALKALEFLVGNWQEKGGYSGTSSYHWMEGGHFLVHTFEGVTPNGRNVKGVEYIGYDEQTKSLRSHLMDNNGCSYTYTYDVTDDVLTTWFGAKGSSNFFTGKRSTDGNRISGRWQWPDGKGGIGGFETIATRI